jgi:P-type Cu2+ transporter
MESPLFLQVEQVGEGTRLSSIIRLMERAAMEKPRVVELADRVASWFVAILLVVAAATAIGWYLHDPARALEITVAVLVVTCPCSLSLATPIALTVAGGALARDGLLVTRGHAIETLARATHFVFDKTGTLTRGCMRLLQVVPVGRLSRSEVLEVAAALEAASEHPIARAICLEAGTVHATATGVAAESGAGVEGEIVGVRYRLGKPEYVAQLGPAASCFEVPPGTGSLVALGDASGLLAWFDIGDEVRPEAAELVGYLLAAGKSVSLFSGDSGNVVVRLAEGLGIRDARAGMTPQQKHAAVQELQDAGAIVAMVGDGVNDAPVLARAQVSIAMGGGAQLARTQADLVLLSDNLHHLRKGIGRATFVLQVIRQNLVWSFVYNVVALPLAIAGYVTPWLAGIGMSLSSLLVVLNSLRIQNRETV